VLLPILAVMLLVGVLRHLLTQLLTTAPAASTTTRLLLREQRALHRIGLLRTHATSLPTASFHARRRHCLTALSNGAYLHDPALKDSPPPNPMTDPAGMNTMMEGMKRNMFLVVPQTLIMTWVNYFFAGFVLVRLPFPLTPRFKEMLQRGVETVDMDPRWVSSLSWYFLCLFGLGAVFRLILGEDNVADGFKDMQAMSTMGMEQMAAGQPGQVQDWAGMMRAERENLELMSRVVSDLDGVEQRVLSRHGHHRR